MARFARRDGLKSIPTIWEGPTDLGWGRPWRDFASDCDPKGDFESGLVCKNSNPPLKQSPVGIIRSCSGGLQPPELNQRRPALMARFARRDGLKSIPTIWEGPTDLGWGRPWRDFASDCDPKGDFESGLVCKNSNPPLKQSPVGIIRSCSGGLQPPELNQRRPALMARFARRDGLKSIPTIWEDPTDLGWGRPWRDFANDPEGTARGAHLSRRRAPDYFFNIFVLICLEILPDLR